MSTGELVAAQPSSATARAKSPVQRLLLNPPAVVGLCCLLLLLAGSAVNRNFLMPAYLLQQLQIAAFLGLAAAGLMAVILLGHIDLSVPWTITTGAMKILAGYEPASEGSVEIGGQAVSFRGPRDAEAEGIVMIHQEFNLADDLTVAQNIFLGHELMIQGARRQQPLKSYCR